MIDLENQLSGIPCFYALFVRGAYFQDRLWRRHMKWMISTVSITLLLETVATHYGSCIFTAPILESETKWLSIRSWHGQSQVVFSEDGSKVVTGNSSTHKQKEGNIGNREFNFIDSPCILPYPNGAKGMQISSATTAKEEYVHHSTPTHLYSSIPQNLLM